MPFVSTWRWPSTSTQAPSITALNAARFFKNFDAPTIPREKNDRSFFIYLTSRIVEAVQIAVTRRRLEYFCSGGTSDFIASLFMRQSGDKRGWRFLFWRDARFTRRFKNCAPVFYLGNDRGLTQTCAYYCQDRLMLQTWTDLHSPSNPERRTLSRIGSKQVERKINSDCLQQYCRWHLHPRNGADSTHQYFALSYVFFDMHIWWIDCISTLSFVVVELKQSLTSS